MYPMLYQYDTDTSMFDFTEILCTNVALEHAKTVQT